MLRLPALGLVLLLVTSFAARASAQEPEASTPAAGRTADAILAELDGLDVPRFDSSRRDDEAYQLQYHDTMERYERARCALIAELAVADPEHEKLPALRIKRWQSMYQLLGEFDAVRAEAAVLAQEAPGSQLAADALYHAAMATAVEHEYAPEQVMPQLELFIGAFPADERAGGVFMRMASYGTDDVIVRRGMYERVTALWPAGRDANYARGKLRQLDGIGKPFELAFDDAITGEHIDLAALHGQVVVVDFWATWCGPCVGEMPHMKELYADWQDDGVQFVGVSLDQPEDKGGLQKLRDFCAENEIAWPQYYQGNYWSSEFSSGWGINSIPAVFVVDREGRLASVDARGQLETLVPELLEDAR